MDRCSVVCESGEAGKSDRKVLGVVVWCPSGCYWAVWLLCCGVGGSQEVRRRKRTPTGVRTKESGHNWGELARRKYSPYATLCCYCIPPLPVGQLSHTLLSAADSRIQDF